MPEYSLEELEKFEIPELHQALLFGNTIKEMKSIDPNRKISTWLDLNKLKIILKDNDDDFKPISYDSLVDFSKINLSSKLFDHIGKFDESLLTKLNLDKNTSFKQ